MDEQAWRLDELRQEARYRRERLELYRARMYGGRAGSEYLVPDVVLPQCEAAAAGWRIDCRFARKAAASRRLLALLLSMQSGSERRGRVGATACRPKRESGLVVEPTAPFTRKEKRLG
jgi:hypothetical protein